MIERHPHPAGFSLVEMLVVLAMLAMVAGLLAGGLGLARAALARMAHVPPDDIATAQRILRGRIERTAPGSLAGTDRSLAFIAPPTHRDAPGAMIRFQLARSAAGDLALLGRAGERPLILLAGIASIDIAYDAQGSGHGWRRSWTARDMPGLVRVRIAFPAGDARTWPDLIVHPRAGS